MLDRISQQLASMGSPVQTDFTPPSPYPTFHPSASDRRVNIFWFISLVCSLSAALLATLVQQWYRAYVMASQHSPYRNPLKVARVNLFLLEGLERLPMAVEAVPGLIHLSVILFLLGLGDVILHIDITVFAATAIAIALCVCFYLYWAVAPIWNPQSPYWTPFSSIIWYLIRNLLWHLKLPRFKSQLARREHSAMENTRGRMTRDVRAVQWLADNIDGIDETETFLLAIPGSFSQVWGRDVWRSVVELQTEGTAVYNLCKYIRNFFEIYRNEGDSMGTKERRGIRGCVETAASFVCCTDLKLSLFGEVGEVGEVLSALGDKERTNDLLTIRSYPSFTVRWTCLSLVAIWTMVDGNELQELAKFALNRIARFQGDQGDLVSNASKVAQRIDDYLKEAWARVVDLHQAFEPWSQNGNKTNSEIRKILNSREASILKLEHIAIEAVGMEDLDWQISLLQKAIDEATHKLTRRLPGVFFDELRPAGPIIISEAFGLSSVKETPISPQLIFPGQRRTEHRKAQGDPRNFGVP